MRAWILVVALAVSACAAEVPWEKIDDADKAIIGLNVTHANMVCLTAAFTGKPDSAVSFKSTKTIIEAFPRTHGAMRKMELTQERCAARPSQAALDDWNDAKAEFMTSLGAPLE